MKQRGTHVLLGRLALGTAIGVLATPLIAQDTILSTGFVGADLGYIDYDAPDSDGDADIKSSPFVGLSGSYNFAVSSNVAIQIDGVGAFLTEDSDTGTENPTRVLLGGLRANYRVPGNYTVGAFAGFGDISFKSSDNEAEDGITYGVEGAIFVDEFALFGQVAGYDGSGNDNESMDSAVYGRAAFSYFLTDDSAVTADIVFGGGDAPNATEVDFSTLDLRYNRQVASRPVEWYVGYQYGDYRSNDGGDKEKLRSNTIYAGVRYLLGDSSTLRNRAVNGALPALSTAPFLAAGYSVDIID